MAISIRSFVWVMAHGTGYARPNAFEMWKQRRAYPHSFPVPDARPTGCEHIGNGRIRCAAAGNFCNTIYFMWVARVPPASHAYVRHHVFSFSLWLLYFELLQLVGQAIRANLFSILCTHPHCCSWCASSIRTTQMQSFIPDQLTYKLPTK